MRSRVSRGAPEESLLILFANPTAKEETATLTFRAWKGEALNRLDGGQLPVESGRAKLVLKPFDAVALRH